MPEKIPRRIARRHDAIPASVGPVPTPTTGRRADRHGAGAEQRPPWRTALITGASSGIGEALAHNLAARGVHVILAARRVAELTRVAQEIKEAGGSASWVKLDVVNHEATVKTILALDKKSGGIDLVIANAGVGISKSPSWSWDAIKPVASINYTGALATITALLPRMVERKSGHVVAISSLAGYGALPDAAGYSSPKAGLSRFMECLALDLQGTGVTVSTVHVGFVKTAMVAKSTIPLLFMILPGAAAEYMVKGFIGRKREINFPKIMVVLVSLLALLPFWLKKFLVRKFSS